MVININTGNSPYTISLSSAQINSLPRQDVYVHCNGAGLIINMPARSALSGTPNFYFISLDNDTSFTVNLAPGDTIATADRPTNVSISGGGTMKLQAALNNQFLSTIISIGPANQEILSFDVTFTADEIKAMFADPNAAYKQLIAPPESNQIITNLQVYGLLVDATIPYAPQPGDGLQFKIGFTDALYPDASHVVEAWATSPSKWLGKTGSTPAFGVQFLPGEYITSDGTLWFMDQGEGLYISGIQTQVITDGDGSIRIFGTYSLKTLS